MTREEREKAIDLLDNLVGMVEDNQDNDYDFALKKGIEALKEEPVIDKIRAEIKALSPEPTAEDVVDGNPTKDAVWEILIEVLKIIDKYDQSSSEIPTGSIHCQHTDAEIAKSFIEDVAAAKDQLHCSDQMDFPNTFDEFAKDYGFKDKDEVYTNGSELIPVFRVKQWLEHISTTKNNLAVDCISREATVKRLCNVAEFLNEHRENSGAPYIMAALFIQDNKTEFPSVTPQPKTGHWIEEPNCWLRCSCCNSHYPHTSIYAVRGSNYCPNCGADMRGEEE